ncbi:MAG: thioredoxin family protein [Candidatus Hodarchaeota archaeon]
MVQEIQGTEELKESIKSAKVTVFDFTAVWCGPCRMLSPILEELSKEFSKAGKNVKIFKIDVDKNMKLSDEYNIHAVPAVAFFKDGEMVGDLLIGVRRKEDYEGIINELLD